MQMGHIVPKMRLLASYWTLKMSHNESIYTMETGRHYKSEISLFLFFLSLFSFFLFFLYFFLFFFFFEAYLLNISMTLGAYIGELKKKILITDKYKKEKLHVILPFGDALLLMFQYFPSSVSMLTHIHIHQNTQS